MSIRTKNNHPLQPQGHPIAFLPSHDTVPLVQLGLGSSGIEILKWKQEKSIKLSPKNPREGLTGNSSFQ